MGVAIRNIVNSTPESRQSKDMFRGGRDAEIVARTNYGTVDNILSTSDITIQLDTQNPYVYSGGTVLLDGRVFLTNLYNRKNDIYDPVSDTITPCIDNNTDKNYSFNGGVLLKNGKVFIPPFNTADNSPAQSRVYDPDTNTITLLPRLYDSELYAGGVALFDGRVYLTPYSTTTALVLNIDTNEVLIPPMQFTTSGSNGSCMLVDGRICTPKYGTSDIFIWNPVDNTYFTGSTPGFSSSGGLCSLADGRIFVIDYSNYPQINYVYDPIKNTILVTPSIPGSAFAALCSLMPDGRIFLNCYRYACFYDPNTNTYEQTLFLPDINCNYFTHTVLMDGRIMFIPTYTFTASCNLAFVGNKLPQKLPLARVCSPVFNRL